MHSGEPDEAGRHTDEDDLPVIPTFICLGIDPEPGCGAVLTDYERQEFEECCTGCMRAWDARLTRWKDGGLDQEFDDLFDACEGST